MRYITILALLLATTFAPSPATAREKAPPPPVFVPHAEFNFGDGGYYTTKEGHRYHFDKEESKWHYGKTHQEGVREEQRREKMDHRK